MSALFGILNLNDRPAEIEKLQQMHSAMSWWGPDGNYLWHEGSSALGLLQLFNTPESVNEKFPFIDNDRGLVFISSSRIDNRNELFELLNIPNEKKTGITDAELIFIAYRKFGKECVHYLLGDWTFAVWNKKEKKLFLARDHHGISGLYYYQGKDFFVFSSSLKGILALPTVPKKHNELRLAQVLVSWPGDGVQTCYNEILRLPPAHYLEVSVDKTEKTRYWYPDNKKELKLKSDNECVEAFNEIFTGAVNCRLRSIGKTGSTLSSGLDSSSVSVVAANILKNHGARLPVFTSVPKYNGEQNIKSKRILDEGPLAAKVAIYNGNMDHYILKSENTSVLKAIKNILQIHDQPVHAAGNAYWIEDMMGKAKELGCTTLLTGQCGNATISWPTPGYSSRYMTPRIPEINIENLIHWDKFKENIIKPVIPQNIQTFIKKIKSGIRPWEKYSAINIRFAKTLHLSKKMGEAGFDPTFSAIFEAWQSRMQIIKPGETIIGQSWLETGSSFGMEVRDPTMDKRIIEFCLSVPETVYIKEGSDRLLIRNAMLGLLPEEVRWNTRRGLQAADLPLRIGAELPEWQQLLKSFSGNDEIKRILDLDKIIKCLDNLNNNHSYNEYVSIVTRGCMVGMWLQENNF